MEIRFKTIIACLCVLKSFNCAKWNDGDVVNVSLNRSLPTLQNSEVYSLKTSLNASSTATISITNISQSLGFLIVQMHSYENNVTLSYTRVLDIRKHVNGTNLGLIIEPTYPKLLYVMNHLPNDAIDLYFTIHAYYKRAPVPGGCNMEFNIVDAPFMHIEHNDYVIKVDTSQARVSIDGECDVASINVTHQFYKMYLSEWDHSVDGYFEGLRKMITVESILKYGTLVPPVSAFSQMRRLYNLYPGTGSFYAVIAKNNNMSSAYVPIHTYGCKDCNVSWIDGSLTVVVTIFGMIINFLAFMLFKFQFLTIGLLLTLMLIYTLINFISESFLSIVIFYIAGYLVLFVCNKVSICIRSPLPVMLALGFQTVGIVYYLIPDGILQFNETFWTALIGITFIVTLLPFFHYGCYVAHAIIGSFCLSILLDLIIGSYLRYIIINVLRRMFVNDFNKVIMDPPYQWRDITVTLFWILMSLVGILVRMKMSKSSVVSSHSTPLLSAPDNVTSNSYGAIEGGSDNYVYRKLNELYYNRGGNQDEI